MATQPTDFLSGLGGIAGLPHPYEDGQEVVQNQNALRTSNLQQQAAQLQIDQQAQAQQRAQQFQGDLAQLGANPTPDATAGLIRKYPEFASQLKSAHDIQDDAKKASDYNMQSQVYSAANGGNYALASKLLKSHRDASVAAGEPADPTDDAIITALDSGDPKEQKNALAMIGVATASIDPDKFDKTFGKPGGGKSEAYTLSPGSKRFDENNVMVAEAPVAPEKGTIERVESVDANGNKVVNFVRVGADGNPSDVSQGSPPSGRTQGGWTPRRRNGGDNPDAAVDNKIVGVAKALGVDPSADISTVSPVKIAQALAFGEGGQGSIADRNNNPTNIRNSDGSYRKFPSNAAAIQAAAALVARKIASGQTNVRTLIEGLPVGGGAQPQGGGVPGALASFVTEQGGSSASNIVAGVLSTVPANMRAAVQAIAEGRSAPPRPGTRNGEAMLDAVTAYDPTFDAANANSRAKTRVDFTSGKSAQNVTAMNTAMGHLLHLDDLAHDLGNFSTLPGLLNPLYNAGRAAAGNTDLGKFEQTKQAAASELRKVFAGSSGGNLEELKQFEANLSSSKSPEQLHAVIQNAVELLGSRLSALQDQYAQGMGRSDQIPTFIKPSLIRAAKNRFGVDLSVGHTAPDAPAASAPTQTATNPKTGQKLGLINGQWVPVK